MPQITFENLKKECIIEFCYNTTRQQGAISAANRPGEMAIAMIVDYNATGKRKKVRDFVKQIEDDCVEVIERTDIRNLKPLIALCPKSVPQWIQNGNYVLEITDKGWTFFKKEFL